MGTTASGRVWLLVRGEDSFPLPFFPFFFTLFLVTEGSPEGGNFPPLAGCRGSAPAEIFLNTSFFCLTACPCAQEGDSASSFSLRRRSRDRHSCCAAGRGTTIRTTAARPTATGTTLIIGTTTSGRVWLLVRGERSSRPESAQGIASSAREESRPVPASVATRSEYQATAGGLVGASRTLVCVFCLRRSCRAKRIARRFIGGNDAAGDPASIRVPVRFRSANTLAGYGRASLTGRELNGRTA